MLLSFGVIAHLLRIKRFEVVGKLAILLGFLGYSTAGMVLLFDLGKPFSILASRRLLAAALFVVGNYDVRSAVPDGLDGRNCCQLY